MFSDEDDQNKRQLEQVEVPKIKFALVQKLFQDLGSACGLVSLIYCVFNLLIQDC